MLAGNARQRGDWLCCMKASRTIVTILPRKSIHSTRKFCQEDKPITGSIEDKGQLTYTDYAFAAAFLLADFFQVSNPTVAIVDHARTLEDKA